MKRVLFIVKRGQKYSCHYSHGERHCHYSHIAGGLVNSAKFIVQMLLEQGVEARLVEVVDNNDIDREVTKYRPDIAIIEALWVVPEKFKVLHHLHPKVEWVVRIHSEVPFLAQEGIAVSWIRECVRLPRVHVAFNSKRTFHDFRRLDEQFAYKYHFLPNFFPMGLTRGLEFYRKIVERISPDCPELHVGCFGAIRPLKNQLIQAMAAMAYAESIGKSLVFHINGTRIEHGEEVIKNLRALFHKTKHRLVEHRWFTHTEFRRVLAGMDIEMAMSFSETFCIVAADAVSIGVPLICSTQVPWADGISIADPTDVKGIIAAMARVLKYRRIGTYLNRRNLAKYDHRSVEVWRQFTDAE